MATRSPHEQLLLELLNEVRLNPGAGTARLISSFDPLTSPDADIQGALDFFGVDGSVLRRDLAALNPADPLLWNEALADAADGHTRRMIDQGQQSHQLPGEPPLGERVLAAGYDFAGSQAGVAENIFAFGESVLQAHGALFIDWGNEPDGLQDPPGHRITIMNPFMTEIGMGLATGVGENGVGPLVLTQNFGSVARTALVGVAFRDPDRDDFYGLGDGQRGIRVAVAGAGTTTTQAAGGWQLEVDGGQTNVTFSGGPLARPVAVRVRVDAITKLDLVDGHHVMASGDLSLGAGARQGTLLGLENLALNGGGGRQTLHGNDGDNRIQGRGGNDIARGADGDDRLFGQGGDDHLAGDDGRDRLAGAAGNDRLNGGTGADLLDGGGGNDVLTGGAGADVFVLRRAGAGERDRITDFDDGSDLLRMVGVAGFADLGIRQQGDDTVIAYGGAKTLVLTEIRPGQLSAGDFDFA